MDKNQTDNTKELVVISDMHLASIWDEVEKSLPKGYPFLNPNNNFREVVSSLKNNQVLIINGDIVTCYYANYNGKGPNNWDFFFDILKKKNPDCLLNLGNHDYRRALFNWSFWSLKYLNMSYRLERIVEKKLGLGKFRLFREFNSILVNPNKFNPLDKYPFEKNYTKIVGDKKLIFLNTSPDVFSKLSSWLGFLGGPSIKHPPGLGMSDEQIIFLANELSKAREKDVIIFIHHPLFFSSKNIKPLKINRKNYRLLFMKNLLDHGVFLKNRWNFIKTITGSDKNIIVVNGHVHQEKQYILEKKGAILRQSNMTEINKQRHEPNCIKFISNLTLGEIDRKNKQVGYLIINDKIKYKITDDYTDKYLPESFLSLLKTQWQQRTKKR